MSANFEPERKIVTAITNADPAVVTAAAHGYESSETVRVNVPVEYGMRLPPEEFDIIVLNANSFSINFDTTLLDPFVVPGTIPLTVAEVLPISQITDNIG